MGCCLKYYNKFNKEFYEIIVNLSHLVNTVEVEELHQGDRGNFWTWEADHHQSKWGGIT